MNLFKTILLTVLSLLVINCSTEPENNYKRYKIKIDKITMADTISVSDTLVIKFYGYVGSDGCHGFQQFVTRRSSNSIYFTVWGEKPKINGSCTQALVFLKGREYKLKLNKSGNFKIIVHQPDNSLLSRTVYVK